MKYYVYLDSDDNAVVRIAEYIDTQDPGFWGRNSHLISTVWTVDASNMESILSLLHILERRKTPVTIVREICLGIGFDLDAYVASLKSQKKKV